MRYRTVLLAMILILIMGTALTACGSKSTQAPTGNGTVAPATADGLTLLNTRCNRCHSMDRITLASKTAAQWTVTVSRMVQNGAKLTSDEQKILIDYLAKTYHP